MIGENAQGKTNALEGIYAFARGKSFRGATDAELVKFGKSGFETEIIFEDKDREQTLTYTYEEGSRKRFRNGVKCARLTESLGYFRAVLFYPEHLQIIKGGPSERRELINVAISQLDSQYIKEYAAYQKILDNRNFLLKTALKGGYFDRDELFAWSEQLSHYAAVIHTKRVKYIRGMSPLAEQFLKEISSEKEALTLTYLSDTEEESVTAAEQSYLKLFTENLQKETSAGCTLWGIHRDDVEVKIGDKPARVFASQGQQRSSVLAMKLAEGEYAKLMTGDNPVYLFDDVLSELDSARRAYVMQMAADKQLIVTACDPHLEGCGYREIHVAGGNYVFTHR